MLWPAAIGLLVEQVTGGPATQLKAPPTPDTKPKCGSSVSVIVMLPLVGALPKFCTFSVNVPFDPITKLPLWLLLMPRSGTGPVVTVAVSVALSLVPVLSDVLATLAELVSL